MKRIDGKHMQALGRHMMRDYHAEFGSFEAISSQITREVFEELRQPNGDPLFGLVRIFRAGSTEDLLPEHHLKLQRRVPYALALMGTHGIEPAWCDRKKSRARQVIPISNDMSPMFQNVFSDLGFEWDQFDSKAKFDARPDTIATVMKSTRYFHIPVMRDSQAITDQETFVERYGIESVVALGSFFISKAAYVLIGFSLAPISRDDAEAFAELTPFVSTLLATYDGRKRYWQDAIPT